MVEAKQGLVGTVCVAANCLGIGLFVSENANNHKTSFHSQPCLTRPTLPDPTQLYTTLMTLSTILKQNQRQA